MSRRVHEACESGRQQFVDSYENREEDNQTLTNDFWEQQFH
jgi:hypothetical protein